MRLSSAPGRLVGEDEARRVDERAGDRDALLLPAGELHRPVMRAVGEADAPERLPRLLAPGAQVDAGIDHRQRDVAQRVHARQQVELLEDEADFAVPERREPVRIQALDRGPGEAIGAGGGAIEAADQVHQGRFAGPGGTHHGGEIAVLDLERDTVEGDDAAGIELVDAGEVAGLDQGHGQNRRGPRGRAPGALSGVCAVC